jgi:YVTN family beta-propeller protein
VLTAGNGTIHVISDGLAIASSHRVAAELADLRLSPAEERLVVLESSKPQVIELDPGTLSVRRSYPVAREAQTLDVSSTGLVAVAGSTMLECIDLTRGKHWRSQIPGQAGQIRFRSDGKLLLAADLKNRSITAWTTPELQLVAELPVAMTPENLVFNADGGQLFISGAGMDAVAVLFPYDTLEVDQTVLAGPDPGVMACSSTPPYLFVGNAKASNVSILNIDTRKVIGIVQVGQRPSCIIVTPDNQYALVLDEGSADLAVIHIQAIKPNRTKSGASLFTVLPLNGRPVNAAILPWSRQPSQAA